MCTHIHGWVSEFRDAVIEISYSIYLTLYFVIRDAMKFLSVLSEKIISWLNLDEKFLSMHQHVKESSETVKSHPYIKEISLFIEEHLGVNTEKFKEIVESPKFVNSMPVFIGLSIIGYLLGSFSGFVIGIILAGLILQVYSHCPKGESLMKVTLKFSWHSYNDIFLSRFNSTRR